MSDAGLVLRIEGFKNFTAAMSELDKVAVKLDTRFSKIADGINELSKGLKVEGLKDLSAILTSLSAAINPTRIKNSALALREFTLALKFLADRSQESAEALTRTSASVNTFFQDIQRRSRALTTFNRNLASLSGSAGSVQQLQTALSSFGTGGPGIIATLTQEFSSIAVIRPVLQGLADTIDRLNRFRLLFGIRFRVLASQLLSAVPALQKFARAFIYLAEDGSVVEFRQVFRNLLDLATAMEKISQLKGVGIFSNITRLFGGGLEGQMKRFGKAINAAGDDLASFASKMSKAGSFSFRGFAEFINSMQSFSNLRIGFGGVFQILGGVGPQIQRLGRALAAAAPNFDVFLSNIPKRIRDLQALTGVLVELGRVDFKSLKKEFGGGGGGFTLPKFPEFNFKNIDPTKPIRESLARLRDEAKLFGATFANDLDFAAQLIVGAKGLQRIINGFTSFQVSIRSALASVQTNFNEFKLRFQNNIETLMNAGSVFGRALVSGFTQAVPVIKKRAAELVEPVKKSFTDLLKRTQDTFRAIRDTIISSLFIKGLLGSLITIGRNLSQGFGQGLSGFADVAKTQGNKFLTSLKNTFGIRSPSTVMRSIGLNVVQGFQQGIATLARLGADSAHRFIESYKETVRRLGPDLVRSSQQIINQGFRNLAQGGIAGLLQSRVVAAPISAAIDFESAFAGIVKTVDVSDLGEEAGQEFLAGMADEIRNLSTGNTPLAGLENAQLSLAGIAETAGQLGVARNDIIDFTEVIGQLGLATDIVGEEGATQLAQFANITRTNEFDRLGATIVALGNSGASTERQILEFGQRLAGAGTIAGLSEPEILAVGNAMASVGLDAEAGSSAFNQFLTSLTKATSDAVPQTVTGAQQIASANASIADVQEERRVSALRLAAAQDRLNRATTESSRINAQLSVEKFSAEVAGLDQRISQVQNGIAGLDEDATFTFTNSTAALDKFAEVAGVSTGEFAEAFRNEPIEAIQLFVDGLGELDNAAQVNVLDDLGLDGLRVADTLRRLSGNSELLASAILTGNQAWDENTALVNEANARFETAEAQLNRLKNIFSDVKISIGDLFLPTVESASKAFGDFLLGVNDFIKANPDLIRSVIQITAAIGGLVAGFITLIGVGQVIGGVLGTVIGGQVVALTSAMSVISTFLFSPLGVIRGFLVFGAAISAIALPLAAIGIAFISFQAVVSDIRNNVGGAGDAFEGFTGRVGTFFFNLRQVFDEIAVFAKGVFALITPFERSFSPVASIFNRLNNHLEDINRKLLSVRRVLRQINTITGFGGRGGPESGNSTLIAKENGLLEEQERIQQRIQDLQNGTVEGAESFEEITIEVGDTLSEIASRTGVSIDELVRLNDIDNPNLIFAGQTLKIPVEGTVDVEEELSRLQRMQREVDNALASTRFLLLSEDAKTNFQSIREHLGVISQSNAFRNLLGETDSRDIDNLTSKVLTVRTSMDGVKTAVGNVKDAFLTLFDGTVEGRMEAFKTSIGALAVAVGDSLREVVNLASDPFGRGDSSTANNELSELSAAGAVTLTRRQPPIVEKFRESILSGFAGLNFDSLQGVFLANFDDIGQIALRAAGLFIPPVRIALLAAKAISLAIEADFLGIGTFLNESGIAKAADDLFRRISEIFQSVFSGTRSPIEAVSLGGSLDASQTGLPAQESPIVSAFKRLINEASTWLTTEALPLLAGLAGTFVGTVGKSVIDFVNSEQFGEAVGGFGVLAQTLIGKFVTGITSSLTGGGGEGDGEESDAGGLGQKVSEIIAGLVVTGLGIKLAAALISQGIGGVVGLALGGAMSLARVVVSLGVTTIAGIAGAIAGPIVAAVGAQVSLGILALRIAAIPLISLLSGALAGGLGIVTGVATSLSGAVAGIGTAIAGIIPTILPVVLPLLAVGAAIAGVVLQIQEFNRLTGEQGKAAGSRLATGAQGAFQTREEFEAALFERAQTDHGDAGARALFALNGDFITQAWNEYVANGGLTVPEVVAQESTTPDQQAVVTQAGADIGGWMVEGMGEGLSDEEKLAGLMSGLVSSVTDPVEEGLGIESPSTVFAGYGRSLIEGLLLGLTEAGPTLLEPVTALLRDNLLTPIETALGITAGGEGESSGATWAFSTGFSIPLQLGTGIATTLPGLFLATAAAIVPFTLMQSGIIRSINAVLDKLREFAVEARKLIALVNDGIDASNKLTGGTVPTVGVGPGRARGGPIFPNTLHPVIEDGDAELFRNSRGQTFLISPDGGFVSPMRGNGRSGGVSNVDQSNTDNSIVVEVNVPAGDISASQLRAIETAAQRGVEAAQNSSVALRRLSNKVGAF